MFRALFRFTPGEIILQFLFYLVITGRDQEGVPGGVIPSQLSTTHAADYISLPLSKLPISRNDMDNIRTLSIRIANLAESEELSKENMPPSLASAVIAYVLHRFGYENIKTSEISAVCDVSEGTLLKCLRRLEQSDDILQGQGQGQGQGHSPSIPKSIHNK